jgi:hypothetical protein
MLVVALRLRRLLRLKDSVLPQQRASDDGVVVRARQAQRQRPQFRAKVE